MKKYWKRAAEILLFFSNLTRYPFFQMKIRNEWHVWFIYVCIWLIHECRVLGLVSGEARKLANSLAKFSAHLQTKWLWVRIPLLSLIIIKIHILRFLNEKLWLNSTVRNSQVTSPDLESFASDEFCHKSSRKVI